MQSEVSLSVLHLAAEQLKAGQVVAFPTETVYGLGANAYDSNAIRKIFRAKGRPSDNPLIVHVHSLEQAIELIDIKRFNNQLRQRLQLLAEKFWPGPLTCIVPAAKGIAENVTAGLDTVGIRIPNHPIALALLEAVDLPIAAPSANLSGKPSPTAAEHVYNDLNGKIPLILDGGNTGVGVESTVLDIASEIPMILRPGGISIEALQDVLGRVMVDPANFSSSNSMVDLGMNPSTTPKSPGMKYTHYAPKGQVVVYLQSSAHKVVEIIKSLPNEASVGLICTSSSYEPELKNKLEILDRKIDFLITHDGNIEKVANNLYRWLRAVDQQNIEYIFIEALEEQGLGSAVMNRLLKAAGGKII
ncbi:threonylcarbamoyl-AMP synthase [Desulfuribacillus alkaliarsenatis]|uniref:Threonylcarbamoyl-AMP synthase n=1 Tax=Desulfuribacillus alkaliarsenatis TaxID=766136 RepID=A0A1E5G1U0_9FIRM|nr:threonylcarbamoyl-AMP synthase [Desulfuribacillus alkaliarsenatis]